MNGKIVAFHKHKVNINHIKRFCKQTFENWCSTKLSQIGNIKIFRIEP